MILYHPTPPGPTALISRTRPLALSHPSAGGGGIFFLASSGHGDTGGRWRQAIAPRYRWGASKTPSGEPLVTEAIHGGYAQLCDRRRQRDGWGWGGGSAQRLPRLLPRSSAPLPPSRPASTRSLWSVSACQGDSAQVQSMQGRGRGRLTFVAEAAESSQRPPGTGDAGGRWRWAIAPRHRGLAYV